MKAAAISTLFALFAIETCWALAPAPVFKPRKAPASIVTFYFEGPFVSIGNYAHFTQCVPEDGNTYPIIQPMVIYSIIPDDTLSNCTFVSATGIVYVVPGYQLDVVPEQFVSVTCTARTGPVVTSGFAGFTSFFPTISTVCPATTGIASVSSSPNSSSVPLYPTGTGYSTGTGTAGIPSSTALMYKRDWRHGL